MRKLIMMAYAFLMTNLFAAMAFAQEHGAAGTTDSSVKAALALAAGFGIALASFGGALGQGRAAASALEGIARNPGASDKIFVPMIIGLALIESLVIYALVIAFMLAGKI
ncbi:MAG: ATP synthase F0 subunit C [Deltaproteobacteria bacterium]|nr:ATP synthase F0 subunit C [Deltaproteobacteria bacterium]